LLIARFHYFGRRGRWREADAMAARIIELDPKDTHATGYHRALLLFTGDVEGFRRANRQARAAGLGEELTLSEPGEVLGQPPVAKQRKPDAPIAAGVVAPLHWKIQDLGFRAYRDGRFFDALRHLEEVPNLTEHPCALTLNGFFRAMAHQ